MTIKPMEAFLSVPSVQLNNYDVVLQRVSDDNPLHFAPSHIGNLRFRVILENLRQTYLKSELFGDDDACEAIVHDVIDTVCTKCIPNGRFFLQNHQGAPQQVEDLHSLSLIHMIRSALQKYPVSNPYEALERSPKRIRRDADVPLKKKSSSIGLELLSRAASKELPAAVVSEETTAISSQDGMVDSPATKDVVITARGISHDHHYVGNNRLLVMFAIRKKDYVRSSQDGKHDIVQDIITSIYDAGGRILQKDKSSGLFKLIPRTTAAKSIRKALDHFTSNTKEKRKHREAEVQKLVQRKRRKDIFNKLEKSRGGDLFANSTPPSTTFNTVVRRNSVIPRAA